MTAKLRRGTSRRPPISHPVRYVLVTVTVWRIGSDAPTYTAEDRTGEGAKANGGRWNSKGLAMVYSASSVALACLETVVHIKASDLPMNRYLVRITIMVAR